MKKLLILFLINFILVLLQTAFFPELLGARFGPNLVLAFALALFFLDKTEIAFLSSLLGGLSLDLVGFSEIGISSFVFVLAMFLLFYVRKYVFRSWILRVFSVFLFCAVYLYFVGRVDYISSFNVLGIGSTTLLATGLFHFVNKKVFDETHLL